MDIKKAIDSVQMGRSSVGMRKQASCAEGK